MSEDLCSYFYEQVVAPYENYLRVRESEPAGRSNDIMAGKIAALALCALREQLPDKPSHETIANKCHDYNLVRDIADIHRHKSLDRTNRLISDDSQLVSVSIWTFYEDEQGEYECLTKEVILNLDDGAERYLLDVLTNLINFWSQELASIGIIDSPRKYKIPNRNEPLTRDSEQNRTAFVITRGLQFKERFQFQRYDYEAGKPIPLDMREYTVEACIRNPPVPLEVTLEATNNITGKVTPHTITLYGRVCDQIREFKSELELASFLSGLPEVRYAMNELHRKIGITPASENAGCNFRFEVNKD